MTHSLLNSNLSILLQEHYSSHNASVSKRVGLVGRAAKKTLLKEKMAEKQIEARPDGCVVVFYLWGDVLILKY